MELAVVNPARRGLAHAAVILAGTLLWAVVWNAADPQGLALGAAIPSRAATDPAFLDHARVAVLWRDSPSTRFVDVRTLAAWRQGHLPGAIHVPADDFARAWATASTRLRPADDLVLYCDGPHCDIARRMRVRLAGLGFERVRVYEGGWERWYASGLTRATEDP